MKDLELMETQANYLQRVARLLSSIDEDERVSLLADLSDRFEEVGDEGPIDHLGTPEEFVTEYLRSAGVHAMMDPIEDVDASPKLRVDTLISLVALPLGVLLLFSFGGQLIFGPLVLVVEWILARMSPTPLRITWSVLAGALVAEIAYLSVDQITVAGYPNSIYGVPDGIVALIVGAISAVLFIRTTSMRPVG